MITTDLVQKKQISKPYLSVLIGKVLNKSFAVCLMLKTFWTVGLIEIP